MTSLSSIEVTLGLILLIIGLGYIFLIWNFNYWKKRGINGPKPTALFGSMPNLITQKEHIVYDLDKIYKNYKKNENFVGIFSMRTPQLLVIDPELIRNVYVSHFKNFHDNEFSRMVDRKSDILLGNNPFMLTGSEWKDRRADITPALTVNRIKASYPVMQNVCTKLSKYIKEQIVKKPEGGLNAKDVSLRYTIGVVSDCVMGIDPQSLSSDKESEIFNKSKNLFGNSIIFFIYMAIVGIFPTITKIYKMRLVPKFIEDFFLKLIAQSIEMRKTNKIDRTDFMNYVIQLQEKKNLQISEILSYTMTFLFDGFETSASVIAHTLLLLGRNQEIQQRLRDEIESNLEADGSISFEKLNDLPFLDQCLDESLRLFSPLLFSSKLCTEDCELKNKNGQMVRIEVGECVLLPIYSIHHDEDIYPEPFKFDPDRFSEEKGGSRKYRDAGEFFPFGDGPRICLGMRFAKTQVKSAVVQVLRDFNIKVNPKTRKDDLIDPISIIPIVKDGIFLDFELLKKNN